MITASTYSFLRDLKKNNNREWFHENRNRYEAALANVQSFIRALIDGLAEFDPHIHTDISEKKCMFRLYRDTRFSLDKTPYKTYFSAGISVDGRKLHGPEYYIHISPEACFIACGYWRPEKAHLDAIRQEIDYNEQEFFELLQDLQEKQIPLSLEDQLKRPPVGYAADHKAIFYLRLKSFVLDQQLPSSALQQADAVAHICNSFKAMLPFKNFIHQAIEAE